MPNAFHLYLDRNKIADSAFSKLMGLNPRHGRKSVYRWKKGQVVPHKSKLTQIQKLTNGEVSCGSWYEPEKVKRPRKKAGK